MQKFGKNLLHLLKKNCFNFDTNPTVDLRENIIWNKTPEALSWNSFHELHYKHPLLPTSVAPSQQTRWCWNLGRTFYTSQTKTDLNLIQVQWGIWEEQLIEPEIQRPWRAPKSRGETHLRVSQSQVAESWDLVARSWLPTLERGRGSSWEPRD
jgi:hypothetical protein